MLDTLRVKAGEVRNTYLLVIDSHRTHGHENRARAAEQPHGSKTNAHICSSCLLYPSRVDSTFEKNRRVLQGVCLCYRLCSDVPCHGTRIDDGFYLCFCFCLNDFCCDHVAANRISIYVLFLFMFWFEMDVCRPPGIGSRAFCSCFCFVSVFLCYKKKIAPTGNRTRGLQCYTGLR
jgi:hypothetical protein